MVFRMMAAILRLDDVLTPVKLKRHQLGVSRDHLQAMAFSMGVKATSQKFTSYIASTYDA